MREEGPRRDSSTDHQPFRQGTSGQCHTATTGNPPILKYRKTRDLEGTLGGPEPGFGNYDDVKVEAMGQVKEIREI